MAAAMDGVVVALDVEARREPSDDLVAKAPPSAPTRRRPIWRRIAGRVRRAVAPARPATDAQPARTDPTALRLAILDRRAASVASGRAPVLVVTYPRVFQVLPDGDSSRSDDPQLGPVLDRLASGERPVAVVGLGLNHRRDTDWQAIEADPRLIPRILAARAVRATG